MLFKNGIDLLDSLKSYLSANDGYIIFVPYIKNDKLAELLHENKNCTQIVVRWLPLDIISGASDLEVFDTCKKFGITLYRNPRLHLKAFLGQNSCYISSANISTKALATNEIAQFNYELGTVMEEVDLKSKVYFHQILMESILVTKELVEALKRELVQIEKSDSTSDFSSPVIGQFQDPFLISALPMTSTVDTLLEIYSGKKEYSNEELNCAAHDLALYAISMNQSRDHVLDQLRVSFNQHPFIRTLKMHIEGQPSQSLNYGGVVRWIQNNTTTVPTPKSWELKEQQLVNSLYDWICYFDSNFRWERPGHSQIIFKAN
ncbi:MAG: hypothetical protein RLO81_04290 [Fulvivirga sp.]|uniref:hypothetical protein n=1 Tax=Fulvivirga sp. TaxID=1931237 RepID=UPI0032EAA7A0